MTKNVNFRFLSLKWERVNLDYSLIVLKMSETNHKKKFHKGKNLTNRLSE